MRKKFLCFREIFTLKVLLSSLILILALSGNSFSQYDSVWQSEVFPYAKDIKFTFEDYVFRTKYDTSEWSSTLTVKYKGKEITKTVFEGWIDTMNTIDFNNTGKKNLLLSMYTGGAHCCVYLFLGVMDKGKFYISDTLYLGNSWFEVCDIDNDRMLEINTSTDMLAYAFTNYAETRFPPRVYKIKSNKFKNVTKNYPDVVNGYIEELKLDLKEFTEKGFECPDRDEDTFNTDAGSVKTILAAITACYHSIGETKKGYELIDKSYKCQDKNKFVKILKDELKLK